MDNKAVIEKARAALDPEDDYVTDIPDDAVVVAHPVIAGVYAIIHHNEWAWVLDGNECFDAADNFDLTLEENRDPFFSAVIRPDNTWVYDPDPDPNIGEDETPVWTCMHEQAPGGYKPTKFAVGERVYPILFHPNIPGGWTVSNADGTVREYWQC